MSTASENKFAANAKKYLKAVVIDGEEICIATDNGNAILLSEDFYNSLKETAYLYGIPGMRESIEEGIATPLEDCDQIDWRSVLK